jgi:hypothetical protein
MTVKELLALLDVNIIRAELETPDWAYERDKEDDW